jgi:two-component system, NarL family, invasion response regulator UvrY
MTMTTVLLIDDQPIVLEGRRRVLEDAGIGNVIQARTLVSGYRLYYRHHSDVIIIDLNIRGPELRGLSLIRRIGLLGRRTRILIFSMNDDPAVVTSALEAGASGYLLKDSPSEELVRAVEQVRAGMSYLSHQLVTQIVFQGRGRGQIRYRISRNGRSRSGPCWCKESGMLLSRKSLGSATKRWSTLPPACGSS